MNLALWIVASVLAAIFAGSGLLKLLVSKDKLVQSGQGWAQDFSPTNIRLIGVADSRTHRPRPGPGGSDWLGPGHGGRGRC
jgi:hypothetical protein